MENDRRTIRRTEESRSASGRSRAAQSGGSGAGRSRAAQSGSSGAGRNRAAQPGGNGRKRFHGDEVYSGTSFGTARARNLARRKKRRRQRRMLLCSLALLILLTAGGLFSLVFRGGNREREELLRTGIASMESGDYEAAVTSFEQELELSGGKIGGIEREVLLYRAEAEYMLGDYEAALHTYEILLGEDEDNATYRQGVAIAKAETGDFAGALDLHAADAVVYSRMAKAQIEAGQYEAAGQSLNQAEAALAAEELEEAGQAGAGQAGAGQAGAGQAKTGQAEGDQVTDAYEIRRAIAFNRAVLCEYQGDFAGALERLETYVQTYGSDEETEREIMFLKTRQGTGN